MTILEELKEYSNNCIQDKRISEYEDYISGEKHKWACMRFLRDIEKEKWEYYWDEKEAQKIVDWFSYLKHSKGVLAGKPIILTKWQKFVLCQLYGWREKKTGRKRFKTGFIEVGRKNAKSQMLAGVALYEMSVMATKNEEVYEVYCAGVKKDQSKLVFNEMKLMLRGSILASKFKMTNFIITHIKSESFTKALSKEDGKKGDGTNPAVLILDEYHQHPTSEFYDLFLGSDVKEGLMFIITTAGVDLSYPCYTNEYTYIDNLLNPNKEVDNDTYFADICEIDKEDHLHLNERILKKANPIRASYEEGMKRILNAFEMAKEVPDKMIAFRTKVANQWVQAKDKGYMDMGKWKDCKVQKIPFEWRNQSVYVGFDMSAKIDLTSVAFIIPVKVDDIPSYAVFSHSFIPNREKLIERTHLDKVPYESWEARGYLTVTNTPIVDQSQVIDYVMNFCKENGLIIEKLCFDPANASKLMMDLQTEGYETVEVFQSHKSLNESTAGFREQVYSKNIYYEPNPLLTYAMGNTVIKQNNGLIKIDKDASKKRIDPIDAVLCGYKLARYHEFMLDINKLHEELYGGE